MPNNIHAINEHLEEMAEERRKEAEENFKKSQLTPEEKKRIKEIQKHDETVVREVSPNGAVATITVSEYAADLEKQIKTISNAAGEVVAKGVHTGDISKTPEDLINEERQKALDAFRKLSVINGEAVSDGGTISDESIIEINKEAVDCLRNLFTSYGFMGRLDSNAISRFFKKMSLAEIVSKLPARFVNMYVKPEEIKANNVKAKDRIIQTLVYLTVIGPEMDYLNEYIEQQNKLMLLTNRLVQCNVDLSEALKSKEKLSDIIARSRMLSEPDNSIWSKYLKGDPKAVHNYFAQQAVLCQITEEAYKGIYEEYKDDAACQKLLNEQIEECQAKYQTYLSVTNLETMQFLLDILITRLADDKRTCYKSLMREGLAAVDRIRKAKQNVIFPVYNPNMAKSSEAIFKLYMEQYPMMLASYNKIVNKVLEENPDSKTGVVPVTISLIDDEVTYHYFSLILLILMGRILKKFSNHDINKYDAIECDCYFQMYCKIGTDVYLMSKVWLLMGDFIRYAIEHWPAPKGTGKKGKQ